MKSTIMPALALAAFAFGMSSQAKADVWWTLKDVTFDDGGAAAGSFELDAYGYFEAVSAVTGAGTTSNGTGGPLAGAIYNGDLVAPTINNAKDTIVLTSSTVDNQALVLTFEYALTTAIADNPIVSGYECIGWSCPNTTANRVVVSGYAAAPEAPTWAMMILGAGLLGAGGTFLRGRARLRAA